MKRQIIAEELAKLKDENIKLQSSNKEDTNNNLEESTTPDE